MAEVQRLYIARTGERFTKTGLSEAAGIGRPTLDNWLEKGVMPTADGLPKLAGALGVEPRGLWLRWFDLPVTDHYLARIADALERMAPSTAEPSGLDRTADSGAREGTRQDLVPARASRAAPPVSPPRQPRDTGAAREPRAGR